MVIRLGTQFVFDILFHSAHNSCVRYRDVAGRDIRTVLLISFQKPVRAPRNGIESVFCSHVDGCASTRAKSEIYAAEGGMTSRVMIIATHPAKCAGLEIVGRTTFKTAVSTLCDIPNFKFCTGICEKE